MVVCLLSEKTVAVASRCVLVFLERTVKVTDRHHVQAFKRRQSLKAYQNVLDLSKVSLLFDKRVQSSHKKNRQIS